jgi:DNA-binding transcriptional MerR regulator
VYGPDAEVRVRWISKLQELGFSLPEVREVLHQWEASRSAPGAMGRIQELYAQKLAETEAQVRRLEALRDELRHAVGYLRTCEVCDPVRLITACSRCELHHCTTPELVAGLHGSRPA